MRNVHCLNRRARLASKFCVTHSFLRLNGG
jgi:hypothetical protein